MASSAARAKWAAVVPRVMPEIEPRAYWSQWGAPRPAKAGTIYRPPEALTLLASFSISVEDLTMPRPSRSHWTTAPPMKTLPSRAYWRELLVAGCWLLGGTAAEAAPT